MDQLRPALTSGSALSENEAAAIAPDSVAALSSGSDELDDLPANGKKTKRMPMYAWTFSTPASATQTLERVKEQAASLGWICEQQGPLQLDIIAAQRAWTGSDSEIRIVAQDLVNDAGSLITFKIRNSSGKHPSVMDDLRPALPAGSAPELGEASPPLTVDADTSDEDPWGQAVDPIDQLPRRVRTTARQHIGSDEQILFTLHGEYNQVLIALPDRVLILKPGYLANTTFGCRATAIRYSDITGIQVNTGMITAVLEISSPSYQAHPADFWQNVGKAADAKANSPLVLPNCLPTSKSSIKYWEDKLTILRREITKAKGGGVVAHSSSETGFSIADELAKLAHMRDARLLTDEEFTAAKKQLLGT